MFNSALSNVGREEGPLENVAFYFLACLARVDKEAHNIYYLLYSIFTELSNKFRTREVDVKISRTLLWLGLTEGKDQTFNRCNLIPLLVTFTSF